jgi:hypothetical protein
MTANEKEARGLARDRKKLHKRLLSAKNCLLGTAWTHHAPWTFNFHTKRLIPKNRKFVLQWKVRKHPERPESYENQQTSVGIVVLEEVKS